MKKDDLEVIEPSPGRTVEYRGQQVPVRPLTVGRLPRFTRACRPVLEEIARDAQSDDGLEVDAARMLSWIDRHGEALVAAVAVATGTEEEWIGEGAPDEFLALTLAVVQVNLDFFVRRLLPALAQAVPEITASVGEMNGGGLTPSSASSPPAIN